MTHTIDHDENVRQIQREIAARSDKPWPTGQPQRPYVAKMGLIGTLPGEKPTTTRGQDIAIGVGKALLPDLTDPKEVAEYFVDLYSNVKAAGPVRGSAMFAGKKLIQEIPQVQKGLQVLDGAVDNVLGGMRRQLQPAFAGTGGSNIPVKGAGDFKPSNVFQSRKADLGQQLRTGTDTYTPTKEVLGELDESMKLFSQKMDRYNELKELRKPFIGLKSPEAKELAKKLGTKYIREGDVNTALRQARDAFSASPRSAVKEYLGEMADLGYDAAKGKPGGKPSTGSGLHQHHIDANVEAYSRTRLLNKLGTTFKVQAQRYIADAYKMAPARARANMANIPGDLHLGDLHPWLKSMGIETYWRDLWKANPKGLSKQQMVSAIDNYFDQVVFPSLVKMDNLVKKSPTKISETHLPQNVVEAARKRLKELTNQPTYKSKFPEGSTAAEVMKEKRIEDLFIKGSEPKSKVWGEALE